MLGLSIQIVMIFEIVVLVVQSFKTKFGVHSKITIMALIAIVEFEM